IMSFFDDTAADAPVRDVPLNVPRLTLANARVRQDVLRMSREELEDKFLRLNDENLNLKQHINKQDDKIKRLATKLMRLVKDRSRLEQLASGAATQPGPRGRDVGMEELIEDLQDNIRSLHSENEGLKQRLRVAKQQIIHQQSRGTTPYSHIHSRINSGIKKLRDTPSPSPVRPKSNSEEAGRPPTGQLPRYGHSLLEEARAEIRNLENVIESQRSHMEALEGDAQLLRDELKKKETEFEQRLLDARQHQTSNLRNVNMIKLQKQLAERSNAITQLEGRFLQLQEQRLKASHDSALSNVDSLNVELKEERLRSLELEKQLQSSTVSSKALHQLQEQISELEQERDLLKENNNKLLNSAFDVSQQQKWQLQEQKLKLQISQLETALQADLVDKNEILDKVKAERETNEKLTEENKKLHIQFLEQKQQLEEMKEQLKVYSKDSDYDVSELTEALLLVKVSKRNTQKSGELAFLEVVRDEVNVDNEVRELRAAHAETIQELEKTRSLLSVESRICKGYKVHHLIDTVCLYMNLDQRLETQAKLLDSRAARIKKLEAQLKDIAYGTKAYVFKPDVTDEEETDEFNESLHLERGENVLELQISSVSLSPSALQSLSDPEPYTFCTYLVHLYDFHSTPVVSGRCPQYGFTSRYVVRMDQAFLDYLSRSTVTVELHQALGLDWRTLASGQIRLHEKEFLCIFLPCPMCSGTSEEARSFGSLDYWFRLRIPMTQTLLLYKEKLRAVDYVISTINIDTKNDYHQKSTFEQFRPVRSSDWNELCVTVQSCSDLRCRISTPPSPYVVYRFYDSPDYPSDTVPDSTHPQFNDSKLYSVHMDQSLHRYLCSEDMQFYVFDYKEEQMDVYLGKAKVPLTSLAQDKAITGIFELRDQSGLPAGHIQLSLKWMLSYLPPPGSEVTVEEPKFITKPTASIEETEKQEKLKQEQPIPPELPQTEPSAKEEPKPESRGGPSAPMAHPKVGPTKVRVLKVIHLTYYRIIFTIQIFTYIYISYIFYHTDFYCLKHEKQNKFILNGLQWSKVIPHLPYLL
uniref:C2 domain-containing protein n=1 Tax=Periophthalmus magnuspinnatus TaxID=409849 RepID=A0A3B4BBU3_9GOBI